MPRLHNFGHFFLVQSHDAVAIVYQWFTIATALWVKMPVCAAVLWAVAKLESRDLSRVVYSSYSSVVGIYQGIGPEWNEYDIYLIYFIDL